MSYPRMALLGLVLMTMGFPVQGQKYHFQTYTTSDGFLPFAAEHLHQDDLGNLWITTTGGLMRYNGKEVRVFTTDEGLSSNVLGVIIEDEFHHMWVASSEGGLARLRRNVNGDYDVATYTTANGLPHNAVLSVTSAGGGVLWVGTKNGVAKLYVDSAGKVTEVKSFLHGLAVHQVLALKDGTVLCGDRGGRLHWSKSESFESRQLFGALAGGINGLVQDRLGNVWASSPEGGIKKLRPLAGGFVEEIHPLMRKPVGPIRHLAVDRSNRVWVASHGSGLVCLDGFSTTVYDQSNGLPESHVVCSLIDRENNLWVGTEGGSLCKLVDHPFVFFDRATGLAGQGVPDILQDRSGRYWFSSSEGGLTTYDGRLFEPRSARDGLPNSRTQALMEDSQGRIWVSTLNDGVYVYEQGRFKPFFKNYHLISNVLVMFEDRERNVWFGTDGFGVARYSPQGQWAQFGTEQGLAGQKVVSIVQDRRGRVWFGCGQSDGMKGAGGLSYWDPERYLKNLNPFITYSADRDFPGGQVNVITFDRDGVLYAGTRQNGLLKYDQGDWISLTRREGLASNSIAALQQDSAGRLWIGTAKGINLWDGRTVSTFTTQHGLISDEVYENAIWCDRRGDVWFGTAGGACRFDVRRLASIQTPPTVYAERIRINGEALSSDNLVRLRYDQTTLDVEVTGIQLKAERELMYQFFLEGFDSAWPDRTSRDFATYTNLDPGSYILRIKAWSVLSGLPSDELTIPMTIHAAFWQTWWFRGVAFLLILVVAPVAFRRVRLSYGHFLKWRRSRVVAHYRIREFIGEGGMGPVYKAWDTRRRQVVVLKVIRDDVEQSADGAERFFKEAEIGRALHHPNIAAVLDAGSHGKSHYVAMEYVEGITLKSYIRQRGKVEMTEALTVAQQILSGLQTLHSLFAVHLDLRSENIMLQKDGVVKIMDAGVAKSRMLSSIMDRKQLVATLAYLSPEQTIGKPVDNRSDLYSMGVILYEMVYGEMPFSGNHEMDLIRAIHTETPSRVASPYLAGIERIIAKAMNRDPQARYRTALEMLAELDSLDKTLDNAPGPKKKS